MLSPQQAFSSEGKMKSQILEGCKEALEQTGLTYLTQLNDSQPLVNSTIAIGLDQNSLKIGGSITDRLNNIIGEISLIREETSEIKKKLVSSTAANLTNFTTLGEQNLKIFLFLEDLRAGQQVLFTKIMTILDAVAYSSDQFQEQFNIAKEEILQSLPLIHDCQRPQSNLFSFDTELDILPEGPGSGVLNDLAEE